MHISEFLMSSLFKFCFEEFLRLCRINLQRLQPTKTFSNKYDPQKKFAGKFCPSLDEALINLCKLF